MSAELIHRGPDDESQYAEGPVVLAFRRLQIIDLSTGRQPMSNEDGNIWTMFNGEIYNYVELRARLVALGHTFRTSSDTEVIVHAYESYGLDFVRHLRGMFAIALWDRHRQRFLLIRDRLGKKPLFFAQAGNYLLFASELKALLASHRLGRTINPEALHDFFSFLCVPGAKSAIREAAKLLPGHILVADAPSGEIRISPYWAVLPKVLDCQNAGDYAEELRTRMTEAVRLRMRSDVPIAAFLSGGIDSSIVVGLMCRQSPKVKTYSIGFQDKRFDESPYAEAVARNFGTDHTTVLMDAETIAPDDLRRLVFYMDEPFADSSFLPTYWLSRITRQGATVALSGDGGDETFGGYLHYRNFACLRKFRSIPRPLLASGRTLLDGLRAAWTGLGMASPELVRRLSKSLQIAAQDQEAQMLALSSYFDEEAKSRLYSKSWRAQLGDYRSTLPPLVERSVPPVEEFMCRGLESSLSNDILVKVDRASMACSLEVRSPFLDQEVVEFAMSIPSRFKMRGKKLKLILKQTFADLLPPDIASRRKQGFELPFSAWFQRPEWKDLLIDALSPSRIERQGIFNADYVTELRDLFLNNPEAVNLPISRYQLRHRVWMLLMFQLWIDAVYERRPA